jgi:hypothetical protein
VNCDRGRTSQARIPPRTARGVARWPGRATASVRSFLRYCRTVTGGVRQAFGGIHRLIGPRPRGRPGAVPEVPPQSRSGVRLDADRTLRGWGKRPGLGRKPRPTSKIRLGCVMSHNWSYTPLRQRTHARRGSRGVPITPKVYWEAVVARYPLLGRSADAIPGVSVDGSTRRFRTESCKTNVRQC